MFSIVAKRVPLRPVFRVGNSQNSLGARSADYGGWVMTGMLFAARNCCTTSDVWLGANAPSHTSLRVNFGCSLLWKWASRGRISQLWRTSNGMRLPNCRRFQKKPSAGGSNNGRIDEASVCVCVCIRVLVWRWLVKRCHMSNHYSVRPHFRELLTARHIYIYIYIYIIS